MKYETLALKEHMIPFDTLDAQIDQILIENKLTRATNTFFKLAKTKPKFSPAAAIRIGYNWRAITKDFLFTVLTGLGIFAETVSKYNSPPYELMSALQSGVSVISDDLSNVFYTLNEMAPKGPDGAHYKWWEDSILRVVLDKTAHKNIKIDSSIAPGVKKLLQCMSDLSKEALGPAVQMRIVEAIALDIALAYRTLFTDLTVDGQKVFPNKEDLSWVNAHIKAEAAHHELVKDHNFGLAYVASSPEEQRKFLVLIKEYADCWTEALNDFAHFVLDQQPVLELVKTNTFSDSQQKTAAASSVAQTVRPYRKWYCIVCDYIYDEAVGLEEDGIKAGTYFEDIPEDWCCADCGVSKKNFVLMEIQ